MVLGGCRSFHVLVLTIPEHPCFFTHRSQSDPAQPLSHLKEYQNNIISYKLVTHNLQLRFQIFLDFFFRKGPDEHHRPT